MTQLQNCPPDAIRAAVPAPAGARDRVNEIDLLRLIAALAVVFFHYAFRGYAADGMSVMPYPWLAPAAKYGFLGVQLFFMISGFVILMTAANGNLKSFAVSRVVRLYPAFWACCSLTFVMILLIGAPPFGATLKQYLLNMTMLSGFVGVPSIDGVYWSLFIEMKFYALVALVLLLGKIDRAEWFLLGWLLLSFVLEAWPNARLRYWLIIDYSAYFIAGAFCYLIWSKGVSMLRLLVLLLCWVLAGWQTVKGLGDFTRHFNQEISPLLTMLIVSLCFAVMLLVALRKTGAIGLRRWQLAGALTYPLYLLHQNIGFMLFNRAYPAINPHLLLWGTVALMLLLAYGVNRLVERPLAPRMKATLSRLWPH